MFLNEKDKRVALQWTVPGSDVFDVKVKYYDIRVFTNESAFVNQFQFTEHSLFEGSLNSENSSAGEKKTVVLNIPEKIWEFGKQNVSNPDHKLELVFVLKSIGEMNESDLSNPVMAFISKNNGNGGPLLQRLNIFTFVAISYSVYYTF